MAPSVQFRVNTGPNLVAKMPEGRDRDFSGDADLDVAITGGGPGGLATAAAIYSALGQKTRIKVCLPTSAPTVATSLQAYICSIFILILQL